MPHSAKQILRCFQSFHSFLLIKKLSVNERLVFICGQFLFSRNDVEINAQFLFISGLRLLVCGSLKPYQDSQARMPVPLKPKKNFIFQPFPIYIF
ncbi:MAG: hypothetical protein EAZ92_14710 [Candidatus Kapaibacterium sp.]|nr:MAG: hypothetical protein EAZ92_14710 [Candidatus Kapabacteria bacterium]